MGKEVYWYPNKKCDECQARFDYIFDVSFDQPPCDFCQYEGWTTEEIEIEEKLYEK
jgi:hypothetical protein